MDITIDLYDQPRRRAVEVGDISTKGMLPAKSGTQLPPAKPAPEGLFCWSQEAA
jgi:hypothetical protein